jgi:serine/threonine protein kinase/tetratricopeptide (TPR) repeat protein
MAQDGWNEIERWHEIKDKLDAVLKLAPEQRPAYLDQVSTADPELRRELESLIASHEQAGTDFLNVPPPQAAADPSAPNNLNPDHREPMIGRRLGTYEIVEQIGAGGMGEVYRAIRADDQYRKQVAIKLVRAGQNSDFVIRRFKNERQILASLDHPNIARLLDGGTTEEGVPYLVMELIEGQPITEYCDSRNLPIVERLKLFTSVCSAVQYAHQRLIVHRDIKPSNILVTHEGMPKLLDFGIAKIVDTDSGTGPATLTIFRALTPGYASPEQVKGEPITTVSDVYALGVVLYELLTGQHPYSAPGSTPHQIARAVCEVDPEKPSTVVRRTEGSPSPGGGTTVRSGTTVPLGESSADRLSKRLSGDLDNIVLMALRKEPERRYASVDKFAEDLRRHLANLPVFARKDTAGYRISKFVARHKAGVAATAAAIIILIVGIVATLREAQIAREQASIARSQRARAEARFNDVRKLANSLMFEVHDSIKDLPGSTPARKLLVSRALEYLDSLSQEAKGDRSLQRELAAAYEKIGDVQGMPRQANLGDTVGAEESYRKALAIRESLAAADSKDQEVRRQLTPNYSKLSDLLWNKGDFKGAMEYSRKEITVAEALYQEDPTNPANRSLLAAYRMDYGYKQAVVGNDRAGGLETLHQGSAMLEKMVSEDPQNVQVRRLLGLSYFRAADVLKDDPNNYPQALALYKKAIVTTQALIVADPNNTDFRRMVAYDQFAMGQLLANMKDGSAALAQDREALSSFQKLAADDPANAQFQEDIAAVRSEIGEVLVNTGKPGDAIESLRLSINAAQSMSNATNPQSRIGYILVSGQFFLGKANIMLASSSQTPSQQKIEHCREASSWFQKCLPAFAFLRDHAPSDYNGADRVTTIQHEITVCEALTTKP